MGAAREGPVEFELAREFNGRQSVQGWLMSEKLDGVRCCWTGEELVTRGGRRLGLPGYFRRAFPRSPLDGELYMGRGRYQALARFVAQVERREEEWLGVSFVVFDAPGLHLQFRHRLEALQRVFGSQRSHFIALAEFKAVGSREEVESEVRAVQVGGGEGVMLRNPSSLYERGRSYGLLKCKAFKEMDCRVLQLVPLRGALDGRCGLVAQTDSGEKFYVGNGVSQETAKEIKAGSRVSVRYSRKKGDTPLNPVFLKLAASP